MARNTLSLGPFCPTSSLSPQMNEYNFISAPHIAQQSLNGAFVINEKQSSVRWERSQQFSEIFLAVQHNQPPLHIIFF